MSTPRVLVLGAGPVGLAFACAARGLEVRVLDSSVPGAEPAAGDFDLRVLALSPGTREFLRASGAWDALDARRIAPVREMEVFGDQGACLRFAAAGRGALAWIVEAGRLHAALEGVAREREGVEVRHGCRIRALGAAAEGGWVELDSGERIEGDLVVGADGADSPLRAALGLAAVERPYGETAIVAHFEVERPHEGRARQWFTASGVLAWLPLPGRRISIVWSAPDALAAELAALDAASFARRVEEEGGGALGEMKPVSATGRFPLRRIRVPQMVAPGAALLGDAAHVVHPLAGQGANLGFRDAKALAEVLAARSPLERCGDLRLLRRFARERREDVDATLLLTDGLDRLFRARTPGARALRNFGLRLVESQPLAKRALAARAMR